ncbi:MAG: type II secretion system F family protein [Phycisphaerales bacterium]
MPVFRYIAMEGDGAGSTVRGELAADTAYQVRLALRRRGLLPRRVTEVVSGGTSQPSTALREQIRRVLARSSRARARVRLIELYENLAALLATGTQISEALSILSQGRDRRTGPVRTLCLSMAERIRQGATLADAMAEHPAWFGAVDVALVRASEHTGETPSALEALAQHHGRSEELKGKLAGALAYPSLLFIFGLGVVIFLTTNTLPQLTAVLVDAGTPVPRLTSLLMGFGGAISTYPLLVTFVLFAVLVAIIWAARSDRLAGARLRVPLFGRVLVRTQLTGASTLLARLLNGGLTLSESLVLVTPTIANARVRGCFESMERDLREGRAAAVSLGNATFIEPTFRQVLAVGEETGELAGTLRTIGDRYRASSSRLIDRLATVLEPVVILVLAVLVGLVVFAAVLPMLRLTQTL